jgi:Ser/Thr protein kinase RdoA (MazF antagonist)
MGSNPPPGEAWFNAESISIAALAKTGFSGAEVYLVRVPESGERYVLKSFPAGVPAARAAWVHALMRHLTRAGLSAVPMLRECRRGIAAPAASPANTLAPDASGTLWEMIQFMPGRPRGSPTATEAAAALEILALLHVAAAALPGERVGPAPPACLVRRIEQARTMLEQPWRGRRDNLGGRGNPEILARLDEAVSIFDRAEGERMLRHLAVLTPRPIHVQPVLRDIWSDHVFFDDAGRVTAIIDFHAAGIDSPATDLARLLGSWQPIASTDGALLDHWRLAVEAYERVRRLDDAERRLVPLLQAAGVVCGLDNWFRWTLDEQRSFPDRERVHARIDTLLAGLEIAIAEAAKAVANLD